MNFRRLLSIRSGLLLGAVLLQLLWCGRASAQELPTLEQILQRVPLDVREFEYALPNFVCNEKIISRELIRGKLVREIVVESIFTGIQNDDDSMPFVESREIKTIDRRPAAKDEPLNVPFYFGGGFSSILDATFARSNIQYHNYKLIGTEPVDGRTALVIQFSTKDDQKALFVQLLGRESVSKDSTGRAWIDLETMHVRRLERRFVNLPPPGGELTVLIDYAEVQINGKKFWMPSRVQAEETQARSQVPMSGQFIAEYSNYQKFEVSVKMKY